MNLISYLNFRSEAGNKYRLTVRYMEDKTLLSISINEIKSGNNLSRISHVDDSAEFHNTGTKEHFKVIPFWNPSQMAYQVDMVEFVPKIILSGIPI